MEALNWIREQRLIVWGLALGLLLIATTVAMAQNDSGQSTANGLPEERMSASDGGSIASGGVTTPPEPRELRSFPPATRDGAPQFVVVSVDGGCQTRDRVITDMLDAGSRNDGRFTFFLSGICLIPDSARMAYNPPGRSRGSSDLPFADQDMVGPRIDALSRMYREGHEIGTHFLGHFCGNLSAGPRTGVGLWSAKDWKSEIQQSKDFLNEWRTYNPGVTVDDLPFDASVIKGARTPCLLGDRPEMYKAYKEHGITYDSSDPGTISWPERDEKTDIWKFPLPVIKVAGDKWIVSMDYNLMVNQGVTPQTDEPSECERVESETEQAYIDSVDAAMANGNAPVVVGTHLNKWVCKAYVKALLSFTDHVGGRDDVHLVTFEELIAWLEQQDPEVLAHLRTLPPVNDY